MAAKNEQPQVIQVVPINQEAERAANMALGRELQMDTTEPGGVYIVNGRKVNANGKPLDKDSDEAEANANDEPQAGGDGGGE